MEQQARNCLESLGRFDWSATLVGEPAHWPQCLRLSMDILLNCPLPMALLWGREQVVLYNTAYAALIGASPQTVPGATIPPVQPVIWSWNKDAIGAAWAGHVRHFPAQALQFWRDGAPVRHWLELSYTPLRDEHGAVRGILCAMQTAAPATTASPARALHILVVEDNLDAQYLVCEMLRTFGHEVDAAGCGEDALKLIDSRRYDVLFSDVSLPGMSGLELAQLAYQRQPQMSIVFATGYGAGLTRHLNFPAVSIQKPYDIEQLQSMLADITRRLAQGAEAATVRP